MSFDTPQSRTEAILQNMLGANNMLAPAQSREEFLLLALLEQGGGGGSGMEKFTCTFTLSGSTLVCDKTFAQITAARTAGKYVEGVCGDNICPLTVLTASAATFQMLVQNSGVFFNAIYLTSADTCIPDTVPIAPGVVTDNSPTPSIAAAANTIYKFGEISSLTISSFPETGEFTVTFTSGSTATVLTEPSDMILPDDFSVEANRRYEISVSDGYAVVASWAVSA